MTNATMAAHDMSVMAAHDMSVSGDAAAEAVGRALKLLLPAIGQWVDDETRDRRWQAKTVDNATDIFRVSSSVAVSMSVTVAMTLLGDDPNPEMLKILKATVAMAFDEVIKAVAEP